VVFTYTDKQLNELNQGKNVYSSNPEYAKRKGYKIVTPSPKNKGETNTIISAGQEFRVVATKSDPGTGFDGLAVAPMVNGKLDYKSIAVIAAGTDPGTLTKIDTANALVERETSLSPQYYVADRFVKEIMDGP
jgi:hypothetical protein